MSEEGSAPRIIAGRYEILRQLGAGGMGAVYEAKQLSMDRKVALKLIHPHIASRPEVAQRFHREMQAMSRIEHPNTIRVFDFGATEDGSLFLAMELIAGRSLSKVHEEDGPLPPLRILHIAKQIVRALGAAHQEGIAHRDLKPDNVMLVDRYGEHDIVKVLDFGIARFIESPAGQPPGAKIDPQMTQEGALLGTPAYMSPEQAMGRKVDHRTDFYSLGVVLYQLGVGKLPFDAPTLAGFLIAHATEPPPPPSQLVPGRLTARFEQLILQLLAKLPDERPSSANALLTSLDACEAEASSATLPDAARPPSAPPTVQPTAAPAPKKRGWSWMLMGVLVPIAGVLFARAVKLRSARAHLDRVLAAHGEPPAPAACRVDDPALIDKMWRAADALEHSKVGEPRSQDREALASLSPETAAPSLPAEYWALAARALLVVDPDPNVSLAAGERAARCDGYAAANNVVGRALQAAKRYDEAKAAYDRALKLAPVFLAPRFNLGLVTLQTGDPVAAMAAFEAVLARDPAYPAAQTAMDQARKSCRHQLGDDPRCGK